MSIKKLIAKAGLVASLLAGATGAYAQDIKVALGTDGFVHMPLFVAVDGGYFKKQGMNVELVKFKGGGAATSGLASRTVEFCSCAIQNSINAKLKGADLTLLGPAGGAVRKQRGDQPEESRPTGPDRANADGAAAESDEGLEDCGQRRGRQC